MSKDKLDEDADSNAPAGPEVGRASSWKEDVVAATGSLVHEIKNPLSTLSINTQLLLEDWQEATGPREQRTVKRLQVMASEIERLGRIIQSFLRFTEKHELALKVDSLNQCLEGLAEFVTSKLSRRGIELRLWLDPELPDAYLASDLIRQVFLNLILNAENAMEGRDGGELILRTRRVERDGKVWAVGDVVDTGIGIKPAAREKVFDLYYSTTKDGSGLGLATSKRIVEEHGGFIQVESETDKGSQFSVFLPCVTEPRNSAASSEKSR